MSMQTLPPTPYSDLNLVLRDLVDSTQGVLGGAFVGAYLQGSFAVGDFDWFSDVDWVIVVEGELTADQVRALQAMHERIYHLDCTWAQHLEGSYFPRDLLRDHARRATPLWYLDNGARALIEAEHDNSVIVRWVLRHHGIALAGPHPAALVDPIPVEALRREILDVIRDWGSQILAKPEAFSNQFYQKFIVLHHCRALHDLQTGTTGSKLTGAEWATRALDPSWIGLIERSWAERPGSSVHRPADPQEYAHTLEFVRYAIEASGRIAAALGIS